jgi:2-isopropylmalate synthase
VGKLSGRRGLQGKLAELGFELEGEALDAVYKQAIALADTKKEVTDADLVALVEAQASGAAEEAEAEAPVRLVDWSVSSGKGGIAKGAVSLLVNGRAVEAMAEGNGPVNALFVAVDKAVEPVVGWYPRLAEYEIRAVSEGEDAQGAVMVRARRSIDPEETADTVNGHGLSTNIIEASLEAYLAGLEKLLGHEAVSSEAKKETLV